MVIIKRPHRLKVLGCLALLAIPFFILNIWVMQKGVGGKDLNPLVWAVSQAIWVLITVRWIMNARLRGFWSVCLLSSVWLWSNVYFLLRTKNYALAFYALFLLILSALYLVYLYRLLREAYYNSGQHWFEGTPRFIPRLESELIAKGRAIPTRLSRLAAEGCCAYPEETNLLGIEAITIKLGDLKLECAVDLISKTKDGQGWGLQFIAPTADQQKDINDFIDCIRSSGYA